MAKKAKKEPNYCLVHLEGGPREDETMRLVVPPPPYVKLAFPDWCVYVLDRKLKDVQSGRPSEYLFTYIGAEVPEELKAQRRMI